VSEVFDPEEILRVLGEHTVDYVLVGGIAVQAYGHIRATQDLDIIPGPDLTNLSRLGEALAALGARLHGAARPVDITDPHVLQRAAMVPLLTIHGRLDLLRIGSTAGTPTRYGELRKRALEVRLGDTTVPVVALDDLIRMKRAAAREVDRADIRALTRSDDELAREAGEST
jgi:hypothetical protein